MGYKIIKRDFYLNQLILRQITRFFVSENILRTIKTMFFLLCNSPEGTIDISSFKEIWKESYSAIGFADELNVVVEGIAGGQFRPSDSEREEIDAAWYTKEEVRQLLKTERFAARTQSYCILWSRG